jgi:teichuronic acid biosynthesis glycosyltransferase TuaG
MNDKPLISCITIFFNDEHFLAEEIESVIAQTYNNWKIILVDDDSTDRSSDIDRTN